jgi:hypothetical protein
MAGAVLMQGGLTASELLQDDVAGH